MVFKDNNKIKYKELLGLGGSTSEVDPIRIDRIEEENKIRIYTRDVNNYGQEITLFRNDKKEKYAVRKSGCSLVQIPKEVTIILKPKE